MSYSNLKTTMYQETFFAYMIIDTVGWKLYIVNNLAIVNFLRFPKVESNAFTYNWLDNSDSYLSTTSLPCQNLIRF